LTGRNYQAAEKSYSGKRVLVLGLARSGLSAMRLLTDVGADVLGMDENVSIEVPEGLSGADVVLGEFDTALLKDCDEIVISPGVPLSHDFVQEALAKGIPVISEIELGYRFCEAKIVALTGTNGKSTTVNMINAVLREAGFESMAAGNVGLPFTSVVSRLDGRGVFVLEISSFQLETIIRFRADVAGILNLTPDHLDRYDSLDSYYRAKLRIIENSGTDDFFFFFSASSILSDAATGFAGTSVSFSTSGKVENGAYLDGETLVIAKGEKVTPVMEVGELKVVGLHNVENALAAIAAAGAVGASPEACRSALSKFEGLPHRMEMVATINGVSYYNDSKATNLEATLMSLKGIDSSVVLIAGGRDKGGDFGKLRKEADRLKAVITIGEAAPLIEEALEKVVPTARSETMQEAVEMASRIADPGQIVLLSPACASFDMFENFEHRGDVFKECVLNLKRERDGE